MGLYRFHIRHAAGLVKDEEETELPDLAAVFAEALRCTRELMEDVSASGGLQLEIADEAGRIVLMVPIYGTGGSNARKEQGGKPKQPKTQHPAVGATPTECPCLSGCELI